MGTQMVTIENFFSGHKEGGRPIYTFSKVTESSKRYSLVDKMVLLNIINVIEAPERR